MGRSERDIGAKVRAARVARMPTLRGHRQTPIRQVLARLPPLRR